LSIVIAISQIQKLTEHEKDYFAISYYKHMLL